MVNPDPSHIGLPPRVFLYTVDQISVLTSISEKKLHISHIFHEGRDIGRRQAHELLARNIAPPEDKPDWRIAEKELIRWMRSKGFKYYDKGTITS